MERGEKREQEIPEKYHHSLFTPGFSLLFVARVTRLSLYLSLSRKSSPLPFARLSRSPILACSPTSDFFFFVRRSLSSAIFTVETFASSSRSRFFFLLSFFRVKLFTASCVLFSLLFSLFSAERLCPSYRKFTLNLTTDALRKRVPAYRYIILLL